ncbi:MAG: VWA domain-containing protein [Candidatus Eisenbacteria bacterium]|nr:VWA domain-containing protein [Candidatus Eisenbacteria bacterium]
MRFADPAWLQALWGVPALALLLLWAAARRRGRLRALADPALAARLSREVSGARRAWGAALLLAALACLALAAARPQFGTRLRNVKQRGIDLVVALDASTSMRAQDYRPDRLASARRALVELMSRLRGDRVGLVAFAGRAVTVCPLTLDYNAVALLLNAVSPETVPEPGTALAEAVRVSVRGFVQKETKYKALLLLTDGEDHEGDLDAAVETARRNGVKIYAVGIGNPTGVPIPLLDSQGRTTGFKRDSQGRVVMTRLEEEPLRRLARDTGGAYFRANPGNLELEQVAAAIEGQEKKEVQSGVVTQFEDRFQWFAGAGFALLLAEWWIGERRWKRRPGGRR